MFEDIARANAEKILNEINKIMNDTKTGEKMFSLKEIWDAIINCHATDEQILIFLDAYEESEEYEILSDKAQSDFAIFKKVVMKELAISDPGLVLYHCIRKMYFLSVFADNLSK